MTALTRLVVLLAAAAFPLVQAADPPKASGASTGKAGGPLLTRAELRDCMARRATVRANSAAIIQAQAELDADKADVARQGLALKEQQATLDRTSADAVAAYNEQALAHDKRVDAYNAAAPAFNTKYATMKSEREAFAKDCENRRFDEKDEIAIKNGK